MSKRKVHLYEKFLKTETQKSENEYIHYKQSFKKRAKKLQFSNLINYYRNHMKMAWSIIKEATVEKTSYQQTSI